MPWIRVATTLAPAAWCALPAGAVVLHVAPGGRDDWSGTLERPNALRTDGPFASLKGARDAIRSAKRHRPILEPVTVADPSFSNLTWVGWVSNATEKTVLYLDNVTISDRAR